MPVNYDKMWEEIIQSVHIDEQQEGEMSREEFRIRCNLGAKAAASILDQLVATGILTKRLVKDGRAKKFVYRPTTSG